MSLALMTKITQAKFGVNQMNSSAAKLPPININVIAPVSMQYILFKPLSVIFTRTSTSIPLDVVFYISIMNRSIGQFHRHIRGKGYSKPVDFLVVFLYTQSLITCNTRSTPIA